jgi:two-component system, NtrC family, sensor histidine kinase HydH
MRHAHSPTTPREEQQRARFEALRRRIFDEIGVAAARWRLAWILPFNVMIVTLLVVRGESATRAVVQAATVFCIAVGFVARTRWNNRGLRVATFLMGAINFLVLIATTGGMASPLLIMAGVMISSAAMASPDPRWLQGALFITLLAGFVGLALLSRTEIGALTGPLATQALFASPDYVAIGVLAAAFTMIGVYRMGCVMSRGYERAALELAERREAMCSEGEGRSRALEGMAARLAHEVKNPLAAIKGLSAHMARNTTDAKSAERLAIVAAEADRLQAIVEGFLSFSRGLEDLKVGPVKPRDVVHELGVLLETRAEEAGVTLQVTGDADLVLDADARKLRQALLNLVLNAIQASPREGVVGLSVTRDCGGVRITVRDEGVGMTADVLDRIRKPYFTTKEGGTGLGVAVARGLIEQHGGQLEYRSTPGKGTTAVVTLPMQAKVCPALPNPLRTFAKESVVGEGEERRPASVGAR